MGTCVRGEHVHVRLIFHGFKLELVSGMACACYAHFPFITITLTDDFNKEFPVESITKSLQQELLMNHCFYKQFKVNNIDVLG